MNTSQLIVEEENKQQMEEQVMTIPIAEIFTSVQGEGDQSGIRMTFFRLAGCTVGKRYPREHYGHISQDVQERDSKGNLKLEHGGPSNPFVQYPSYVNQCTAFDGRHFPCDTDYGRKETLSIAQLLSRIPEGVKWVSITGGEPLMYMDKVIALCKALRNNSNKVHLETSGTIHLQDDLLDTSLCYIACSPKANYLPTMVKMANEIRLMVDKDFNIDEAKRVIQGCKGHVFLSPLSRQDDIMKIDRESMAMCLKLQAMPAFSHTRISIQAHKILGVR